MKRMKVSVKLVRDLYNDNLYGKKFRDMNNSRIYKFGKFHNTAHNTAYVTILTITGGRRSYATNLKELKEIVKRLKSGNWKMINDES